MRCSSLMRGIAAPVIGRSHPRSLPAGLLSWSAARWSGATVVDVVGGSGRRSTSAELGDRRRWLSWATAARSSRMGRWTAGSREGRGFADPGCSRATTTPMTRVAPVAATTAVEVRRRILAWALARARRLGGGRRRRLVCWFHVLVHLLFRRCPRHRRPMGFWPLQSG